MSGSFDRYGNVLDGDALDGTGVQLTNKPLMGLVIVGTGSFGVEIQFENGGTWYALDPQLTLTAGVAISSDVLAPLAAYCINPVKVRLDSYTGVTRVVWIVSG